MITLETSLMINMIMLTTIETFIVMQMLTLEEIIGVMKEDVVVMTTLNLLKPDLYIMLQITQMLI